MITDGFGRTTKLRRPEVAQADVDLARTAGRRARSLNTLTLPYTLTLPTHLRLQPAYMP